MAETRTYGVFESPESDEVPAGLQRISLVTDDRTGMAFYQVERDNGSFYLCDADGDVVDLASWTLQRVLADTLADDSDAFFEAVESTAKRTEAE